MSRNWYKMVDGELVDISEERLKPNLSDLHYVQDDTMEPTESMATDGGAIFTSKSAYKRHLREHGYEITGGAHLTGNTKPKPYKADREKIKETLLETERKLKWGMIPADEKENETCQQQERDYQRYKKRRA